MPWPWRSVTARPKYESTPPPSIGAIYYAEADFIYGLLTHEAAIKKSRIHPFDIFVAQRIYVSGRGVLGDLTWTPNRRVVEGLEYAFYQAFANVEPTNKKYYIGLDISCSMWTYALNNHPYVKCAEAGSVLTMAMLKSEKNVKVFHAHT
jgi:60 kDa SS-A/Ro ribonucleoprotein